MIFIVLILCILLFVIFLLSSMKRSYKEHFGTKSSRTATEIQTEIDSINTQILEWETIKNNAFTTLNNTDNITSIDDLYTQINADINEKCPWKGVASSSSDQEKAYKCLITEPVGYNNPATIHPKKQLCTGKTIDNTLSNGSSNPCNFISRETSRTYDLKYISDDNKFCIGHFGGKSKCELNCKPDNCAENDHPCPST
jgi:hypothetical protein